MSEKTIIITGGGGFVAPYVAREFRSAGINVRLVVRDGKKPPFEGVEFVETDLSQPGSSDQFVEGLTPEAVVGLIHLAGYSHVGQSWAEAATACESNIIATVNAFEGLKKLNPPSSRFIFASSAEVYGKFDPKELPLSEFTPINPSSPYGVSKYVAENLLKSLAHQSNIELIVARCFNHIGPSQDPSFALPSFADQIAAIEMGEATELIHGNLETSRDFLDVRDVARAYRLLFEKGRRDDTYVVASGQSHRIREMVERMIAITGIEVTMRADASRFRVSDTMELRGDPDKLKRETGWEPKIPLETTLADILADARNRSSR